MQLKRLDGKASAICKPYPKPNYARRRSDTQMEGRADVPHSGPLGSQLSGSHGVGPCSEQLLVLTWGPARHAGRGRQARQAGNVGRAASVRLGGHDEREGDAPCPPSSHDSFLRRAAAQCGLLLGSGCRKRTVPCRYPMRYSKAQPAPLLHSSVPNQSEVFARRTYRRGLSANRFRQTVLPLLVHLLLVLLW